MQWELHVCDCNQATCAPSIQALLSAPNPEDPLDEGVAKHWKDNEDGARDVGAYVVHAREPHRHVLCAQRASGRGSMP